MDVWFIRANGTTGHNEPGTRLYIQGEPPTFPERDFDYSNKCLAGGFIRIGWPAAGDLRKPGWRDRALEVYGDSAQEHHLTYLQAFLCMEFGDLVLTPAGSEKGVVYIGRVVGPYYYHYDTSLGDWFENAHRVPVAWCRDGKGNWATRYIAALGGPWRRAFSRVGRGRKDAMAAYRDFDSGHTEREVSAQEPS